MIRSSVWTRGVQVERVSGELDIQDDLRRGVGRLDLLACHVEMVFQAWGGMNSLRGHREKERNKADP